MAPNSPRAIMAGVGMLNAPSHKDCASKSTPTFTAIFFPSGRLSRPIAYVSFPRVALPRAQHGTVFAIRLPCPTLGANLRPLRHQHDPLLGNRLDLLPRVQ